MNTNRRSIPNRAWRRLALAALVVADTSLSAQSSLKLPSTFVEFERPFIDVISVRELANGALIVIDRKGGEVVLVRGQSDQGLPVGRRGSGPREYRLPHKLIGLPGDSTILTDGGLRRWLVMHGAGIVGVLGPDHPAISAFGGGMIGADERGRIVSLRGFSRDSSLYASRGPGAEDSDSALVISALLVGGRVDTVARIKGGWLAPARRLDLTVDGQRITYLLGPLVKSGTQVAVCPDGSVAFIEADAGAMSISRRTGLRWITRDWGALARDNILVTEVTKRAIVEREYGPKLAKLLPAHEFPAWPSLLPEVERAGFWCPRIGELVIARNAAPGAAKRFEVVRNEGRQVTRILLPARTRIAGFGRSSLYLVQRDGDDVEHVLRFPWPISFDVDGIDRHGNVTQLQDQGSFNRVKGDIFDPLRTYRQAVTFSDYAVANVPLTRTDSTR